MTRIERDSDRAHPLPGRADGEAGGASLILPCDNDTRADAQDQPKRTTRVRTGRVFQEDARSCVVSGDESGDESADGEGGEG